jgi:hypothetical protein
MPLRKFARPALCRSYFAEMPWSALAKNLRLGFYEQSLERVEWDDEAQQSVHSALAASRQLRRLYNVRS